LKHLAALNHYFWKYRYRFFIGIVFVISSNYFAVLAPQVTGYVVSRVQQQLPGAKPSARVVQHDWLVDWFVGQMDNTTQDFAWIVAICCITILALAVIRGLLMFFMRQTIIVMSRHIEYDQKNEIYQHYQQLDTQFYKTNSTGDLMNRMAEDVSRVRMYTGPAIMYFINLVALISFCVVNMFRKDAALTLYVLAPLPLLAITIYYVNSIINRKSEQIQGLLSSLTTNAQESYSGIRVIKSFVQEKAMLGFFTRNSEEYKQNAIALARVEAVYFPSMTLLIGISTLVTILIGGLQALEDSSRVGTIVEFVIYINMLNFPVSAIGWTASIVQRAAASQKRINEFMFTKPVVKETTHAEMIRPEGDIVLKDVSFTYPHTGIRALNHINLHIKKGERVLLLGRTGSGKTSLAQLLLRFYEPDAGSIEIGGRALQEYELMHYREQISYVPQDVFLFSDTVADNIAFGLDETATRETVAKAAAMAGVDGDIAQFAQQYDTMIGERGVTLSGGQKQRISIARALIKQPSLAIFDDCLSAVDARTERLIVNNLDKALKGRTAIIITHRIPTDFHFDTIVVLENGSIAEMGNHDQLMKQDGLYAELFRVQRVENREE
jgi:ATP-binding cassette subfamily B protein